ncbi:transposase [Trichonephila inaurata madagascariensis]|uniref:Transposase n=1 Tax=Trichonephila inaurata madagascariensis TaxID=2747483 RepID=A0A8X6YGY0_9ARAC|nr:transposase [Trichonephila inaurata madagascariensis]
MQTFCNISIKCVDVTAAAKSYNLNRLFEQKHGEIDKLTVGEWKATNNSLKNYLISQQYIFHKQTAQSNGIVSANIRVSHIIAKNMKPFTYGNWIKVCLIAVVEKLCSEKLHICTRISLSRQNTERRTENISSEICTSININTTSFVYFLLALDESSDIKDTTQHASFIRGFDIQMNITEELFELVSLIGTTTGRYIKDAVINCSLSRQTDLKKLNN